MGDSKSGFFYSSLLPWSYLAYTIVDLTVSNLTFAIIGVTIVLVLLMDIRMSIFIILTIGIIDIGMFLYAVVYATRTDSQDVGCYLMLVLNINRLAGMDEFERNSLGCGRVCRTSHGRYVRDVCWFM